MATKVLARNATDNSITEISINTAVTSITATNSSGGVIATNKAVNIYNNAGVITMRLADSGATNNYPVSGFTTASVANSAVGTVQPTGLLAGFTSLTPGATYFSDPATPGSITVTVPTTTNQKAQTVGYAQDAATLNIIPGYVIQLA